MDLLALAVSHQISFCNTTGGDLASLRALREMRSDCGPEFLVTIPLAGLAAVKVVALQRHATWEPPERVYLFVNRPTLTLGQRASCTFQQTLQWSGDGTCVVKLPGHLFSCCQSLGIHLSSAALAQGNDDESSDDSSDHNQPCVGLQQMWCLGAPK
jgi:hypothetical protein